MKGGASPSPIAKLLVCVLTVCSVLLSECRQSYPDPQGYDVWAEDRRRGKPEVVPEDSFIDNVGNWDSEMKAAPVKVYVATRARQLQRPTGSGEKGAQGGGDVHATVATDFYFVAIVAGCSAAAVVGIIGAGFCYYNVRGSDMLGQLRDYVNMLRCGLQLLLQKNAKAAAEADYPVYGVTGPNQDGVSPTNGGDRKLAHSAQMYHYQHQKQQMIAMGQNTSDRNASTSDLDSEEENEEGDYTVYECPGLAPTGEMEVKNPLFHDDSTPVPPSPPPSVSVNVNVNSNRAPETNK